MALTRLGWDVHTSSNASALTNFPWITGKVRKGDAYTILNYLAERYNAEVEPITRAHSWGWNYRPVRGASVISEHAAGTAVDFNAPKHGLGTPVSASFSAKQIATMRRILDDLKGAVRFGGFYSGRPDPMHWELQGGVKKLAEVAALIKAGKLPGAGGTSKPSKPAPSKPAGNSGDAGVLYRGNAKNDKAKVKRLQAGLNRVFPAYAKFAGNGDGDYGKYTEDVVKEFQRRSGLKADGVVGKDTINKLAANGITL